MSTTRRTLLAFLGLAPASAAIGSETFRPVPKESRNIQCGNSCTSESMTAAFRHFADGIEKKQIEMISLGFASALDVDKIAEHEMIIRFYYLPEIKS